MGCQWKDKRHIFDLVPISTLGDQWFGYSRGSKNRHILNMPDIRYLSSSLRALRLRKRPFVTRPAPSSPVSNGRCQEGPGPTLQLGRVLEGPALQLGISVGDIQDLSNCGGSLRMHELQDAHLKRGFNKNLDK